jgi:predicted nucleic acid-binding protein
MRALCCLRDPEATLVADTSAIINLNATGCAAEILRAVPNEVVVVDMVPLELRTGRGTGHADGERMQELIRGGLLHVVSLGEVGWVYFGELVAGPASETLGDGEAGTLAYAAEAGANAIIDERKAIRVAEKKFSRLVTASTVDILCHPAVLAALKREPLAVAVFQALRDARMRVFDHHLQWVVELIGSDRAAACTSLPRSARTAHEKA